MMILDSGLLFGHPAYKSPMLTFPIGYHSLHSDRLVARFTFRPMQLWSSDRLCIANVFIVFAFTIYCPSLICSL